MDFSRFKSHYLLHDRGAAADVDVLATIMAKKTGTDSELFKRPQPPYAFKEDASALESYQWLRKYFLPECVSNSVIFGLGLGGLLAARLQEEFPAKNLSVVAINSVVNEDNTVVLSHSVQNRVALYSSSYPPIVNQAHMWASLAPQAYDMPWLAHGIRNTKYGLAYLMTAYMMMEDISKEVTTFMEASPALAKAKAV